MMRDDRTNAVEREVLYERKPNFSHLTRLFAFAFTSAKVVSCVYLGLFIVLSFLRPALAFIWGNYIRSAEAYAPGGDIVPAILLIVGYLIINFIANLINEYVIPFERIQRLDIIQSNRQRELFQSKMYEKLASFSPEVLEIPVINDRIEQVFNFVGSQWGGMNTTVMMNGYIVIARAVSVITIAASLYIFNPWLCLIVLAAPLPTLWSLTVGQRLRFKFVKDNTQLLRKTGYFQELMLSPASKELKTLGLHDFFYKKWKDAADEYTEKEKKLIRTQAILQIVNYFLLSLANVGGGVFAIVLMALGRLTLGALGAALSLISTLVSDTKELLAGFATVYMKKNEAAQFFDLMELPEQKNAVGTPAGGGAGESPAFGSPVFGSPAVGGVGVSAGTGAGVDVSVGVGVVGGADTGAGMGTDADVGVGTDAEAGAGMGEIIIEAKQLKYRYPLTESYVLDGIDLRIRKGERIAFVGENGAGKTTLVKLINGTLAPSSGELLLNGISAELIDPIAWYGEQSAVVQNPARYVTFTVADNVFIGDAENPRDEVFIGEALTFSGLGEIDKNRLLGKDIGGVELSGGQWQKLAIAKAAYRNRNFIILDEPTSNLDPLAETEIFKNYMSMAEAKTVIFVTHRISVASLADRIIVFVDGKIAQDGTHEDLINCEGEYSRLYNEQAKWYDR